jgi:hypothetical protein
MNEPVNLNRYKHGFTLTPPEDAAQTAILPVINPIPTKLGNEARITAYDYLSWLWSGLCLAYANNRGGVRVMDENGNIEVRPALNLNIMEVIYNSFNPKSLGHIQFALIDGRLVIVTGHNRAQILFEMYWRGLLTAEDLKTFVFTTYICSKAEFIQAYINEGQTAPHDSKATVMNPDLCYGNIFVNEIGDLLPPHVYEYFFGKKVKLRDMLSRLVHAVVYSRGTENWAVSNILCDRMWENFKKKAAGTISLSFVQRQEMADVLVEYCDLIAEIKKHTADKSVKILTRNVGFCGMVLIDRLSTTRGLPQNLALAKRVAANLAQLIELRPTVGGSKVKPIREAVEKIFKLIGKKGNSPDHI